MASQCYPKARQKFGGAQLSWTGGVARCVLLPESYTPNLADEFLSDISSLVRIAISEEITGRTITNGFANSNPIYYPLLLDNRRAARAVIYKDTMVEATSPLIFLLDIPELVNVPFELRGFDFYIYPNAGEGGFFRL